MNGIQNIVCFQSQSRWLCLMSKYLADIVKVRVKRLIFQLNHLRECSRVSSNKQVVKYWSNQLIKIITNDFIQTIKEIFSFNSIQWSYRGVWSKESNQKQVLRNENSSVTTILVSETFGNTQSNTTNSLSSINSCIGLPTNLTSSFQDTSQIHTPVQISESCVIHWYLFLPC